MNKLNKLYLGISLAICSMVISQNAIAANEKYVLRVSHTDRANSIKGKFFIRFKELLEEKHPNVTVELNEYGKIAKRKQEIDLLELGVVDMIAPDSEDVFEKVRDEKIKLVSLPYLFEKNENFYKFIKSPARINYINSITNPNKKYIPLTIIGEGYDIFAAKAPLTKAIDLEDKELITSSLYQNQTFFNQLKMRNYIYSDFDDVNYLNSISKGNLFEINKQKFMNLEMIDYFPNIYLSDHKYTTSIVLINKNWLDKIPENIKKSIKDLLAENTKYNEDLLKRNEDMFEEKILKVYNKSMVKMNNEDKEYLHRLAKPMHEYYLERINRELLLETYKVIQK